MISALYYIYTINDVQRYGLLENKKAKKMGINSIDYP